MNIDRLQGLIDLYLKAGKSRTAVLTMADYFLHQGLITQEDVTALLAAIDAQDAQEEPLDLRAVLAERDDLRTQVADLSEQRDAAIAGQESLQTELSRAQAPAAAIADAAGR